MRRSPIFHPVSHSLMANQAPLANQASRANHQQRVGLQRCPEQLSRLSFPCIAAILLILVAGEVLANTTLSDFNNNWDFGWDFDGFSSTPGATSNLVQDPDDGWGGSGRWLGAADFSAEASSYLTIDLTAGATQAADTFAIELTDTNGISALWRFSTSALQPGVPTQLVATAPMSAPHYGENGHGGPDHYKNFDLSSVQSWQIQGEYGSPYPVELSFDNISMQSQATPPEYYAGRDPNAAWRTEAATRIDAVRKANLQVKVTDAAGNPLPGATVAVAMQEHEFRFGTESPSFRFTGSGSLNTTYREKVLELFNTVTPQDFGWRAWEGEAGVKNDQATAFAALDWLQTNGLDAYGHVYAWPDTVHTPAAVQAKIDEFNNPGSSATRKSQLQGEIGQAVLDHIADKGAAIAGKVRWMNVVNELRNNRDLLDILGDDVVTDWFLAARAADPNIGLHINEAPILVSAGSSDTSNQQGYYDLIQSLQNDGAPITGVGLQSHFTAGTLTGPEQVWDILDRYHSLGLDLFVTEFDFDTVDEQLQADFTRDFMTAVFAHEGIDAFIMWGFSEWSHWRRDAAMFDLSWNIKPNGQAYKDLVLDDWWTDEAILASALGEASLRAFKGEYEITVTVDGQEVTIPAILTEGGLVIDVTVPVLLADFDIDGDVDGDDYVLWEANFGRVDPSAADADRDGDVDGTDFLTWQRSFDFDLNGAAVVDAVPEPSSIGLLLCCGLHFARTRSGQPA